MLQVKTVEIRMEMVTMSKAVAKQLDVKNTLTLDQWKSTTVLGRLADGVLGKDFSRGVHLVMKNDEGYVFLMRASSVRVDPYKYELIILQ